MAVSIDTVYQRVLAILNKENRGYVTPQEFNLFANQAQLEVFEQYFFDLNQYSRLPKNDTEYSDLPKLINEKLSKFKQSASISYMTDHFHLPTDFHKLGTVIYNNTTPVEQIDKKNLLEYQLSKLTAPTTNNPVYIQSRANAQSHWAIQVYPTTITSNISITYVRKPNSVTWASQTVAGNALYNASASTDFELHASEETNLVLKILLYAGVSIKDPNIAQLADAKETKKLTQEKS
tara:strand:- start:6558 stop:7262 length:705 start_codon:yes stop_codon:yes gene_type:complete